MEEKTERTRRRAWQRKQRELGEELGRENRGTRRRAWKRKHREKVEELGRENNEKK